MTVFAHHTHVVSPRVVRDHSLGLELCWRRGTEKRRRRPSVFGRVLQCSCVDPVELHAQFPRVQGNVEGEPQVLSPAAYFSEPERMSPVFDSRPVAVSEVRWPVGTRKEPQVNPDVEQRPVINRNVRLTDLWTWKNVKTPNHQS